VYFQAVVFVASLFQIIDHLVMRTELLCMLQFFWMAADVESYMQVMQDDYSVISGLRGKRPATGWPIAVVHTLLQ
jgi:hypothetical protein